MTPYAIGLDIGISSVGWAEIALTEDDTPRGILNLGSRIFDAAEQPKTGESLAAPRREARSIRRRLRRHRHRAERIRQLIVKEALLSEQELAALFDGQLSDIYALRVKALDELVTRAEFARILIHISQRRGFRSNRKNPSDKEEGKLLEAISQNRSRMKENGYRTVAEMMLKDPVFAEHKRNKGGNYLSTVTREMVEEEVELVFHSQAAFGASFATERLKEQYLEILLSQRSFDDGPGGNSPYGGNQIEKMVGKCEFEPTLSRAAKATYSFEYFNLLQNTNHIRISTAEENRALTPAERRIVVELAHKTENLDYAKLRKALQLTAEDRFSRVRYEQEKSPEECEKKEKFQYLKAYHQIRKALDKIAKGHVRDLSRDQLNSIGTALTLYKTEAKIRAYLKGAGLDDFDIDSIVDIGSFSRFGHLSTVACDKIIPYLEQGMTYSDAATAAGYHFRGHAGSERSRYLQLSEDDIADITSPVVRRAISQTVKVVNAIIRERDCSPVFINNELAREMAKDFNERNKIRKENEENHARNDKLMEMIREEFGKRNATGQDLLKQKLFNEQGGVCAYSLKQMSQEHLFDPGYAEIDHIIPYSLSFDDSMHNKVLVFTGENRNKGNRLPLEYLTGKQRDDFIVWTKTQVRDYRKRQKLLKEHFTEEDSAAFKERNLQDTKHISRFMMNYLADNLEFAPSGQGRKKRVTAVNGALTSYLRKRWGITKIRENGDLHHAIDAVVIACATDSMIQQISRHASLRECGYVQGNAESFAVDEKTGEVLRRFPYPWPDFKRELEARTASDPVRIIRDCKLPFYWEDDRLSTVKPIFVSRMAHRKVTGAAHLETVKSDRLLDDGFVIAKRPLTDLKLKNGEIENYYAPESDRLLYEALRDRLVRFNGNAAKAFAEPFYKPKHDGSPGPLVKKVKISEKSTLQVPVYEGKGVAANDSMVRIDVFFHEGDGYYFVPIYVADTLKPTLPNKACVAGKPYQEWKEVQDGDFIFSLYPGDLIKATHRSTMKLTKLQPESSLPETVEARSFLLYFKKASISTASITCITHDSAYGISSLGIKTLDYLEKYSVDILGAYHAVKKEKRQTFANMKRS